MKRLDRNQNKMTTIGISLGIVFVIIGYIICYSLCKISKRSDISIENMKKTNIK